MYKLIFSFLVLSSCILSCSTMNENTAARERLKQCRFRLIKAAPTKVETKGTKLRAVHFDLYMKVTNNSDGEVALDRVTGDILLDSKKAASFNHSRFQRVAAGSSSTAKVKLRVPIAGAITAISSMPKKLTVDATAYVKIIMGNTTLDTDFPVEINKSFDIPYNKIKKMVMKKAGGISF